MKSQNSTEINSAYKRFMIFFSVLLLMSIISLYFFSISYSSQVDKLLRKKNAYEKIFLNYRQMSEKIDTMYNYSLLLNIDSVYNQQGIQQMISLKRNELLKIINPPVKSKKKKSSFGANNAKVETDDTLNYYAIYRSLALRMNDLLVIKNQIQRMKVGEREAQKQLLECIQNMDKKQKKRTNR